MGDDGFFYCAIIAVLIVVFALDSQEHVEALEAKVDILLEQQGACNCGIQHSNSCEKK